MTGRGPVAGVIVSLTSTPPRLPGLPAVLEALTAQEAVAGVLLTLPERWPRFPGAVPELPAPAPDVRVQRVAADAGPALKYLGPLAAGLPADAPVLACDDDWLYAPGWAAAFAAADDGRSVLCASSFPVRRIDPAAGESRIAQGFAGVLFRPGQIPPAFRTPPADAFAADDIWFSAAFAAAGAPIRTIALAGGRPGVPVNEAAPLQDACIGGLDRATTYRRAVRLIRTRFGLWSKEPAQAREPAQGRGAKGGCR